MENNELQFKLFTIDNVFLNAMKMKEIFFFSDKSSWENAFEQWAYIVGEGMIPNIEKAFWNQRNTK